MASCMWGRTLGVAKAKSDGKMAQLEKLDQTLEDHKCQAKISPCGQWGIIRDL